MRILSDWLRRHRSTVREVKATSKKLVELLAESVLLYEAELWVWGTARASGKCADVGS